MKKVILVGPSLQALEGFDLSECKNYDIVVGTNKVMESELAEKVDFDVIFLNTTCAKYYCNKEKFKKLEGKTIFTKERHDANRLIRETGYKKIYDIDKTWEKMRKQFSPHVPYYGTAIVSYLKEVCDELFVVGFDFYLNGFSAKKNYVEGYYDLQDKQKEEACHSIAKDLEHYSEHIVNDDKVILEESVMKCYIESRSKHGV